MQKFAIVFILSTLSVLVSATTQPVIYDTKANCTIDGKTGDCCEWEDIKIWPGELSKRENICQTFWCTADFDIYFSTCPFDIYGRFHYINGDNTKDFPECCGEWVKVNEEDVE